jgi:hypothetical protein
MTVSMLPRSFEDGNNWRIPDETHTSSRTEMGNLPIEVAPICQEIRAGYGAF